MFTTQHYIPKKIGILVSIKNGAWFESAEERGLTHLAEYAIQQGIINACAVEGIPESSFWIRGITSADHVRFAVFCRNGDAERMRTIVRDCLEHPVFTEAGIHEEMRMQRIDYLNSLRDPYFRAATSISRRLSDRNPSIFGKARMYMKVFGPTVAALTVYWERFWSASVRDVVLFGEDTEQYGALVTLLSSRISVPEPCTVSDQKIFIARGRYGVSWHESCYHPLYNIFDAVMVSRTATLPKGILFSILDRGTLRAYVISNFFHAKRIWKNVFANDVAVDEWLKAKDDWMTSAERVLSGTELYDDIFEWDDCTPSMYGDSRITSLQRLAECIKNSSYEEFTKYWNEIMKKL